LIEIVLKFRDPYPWISVREISAKGIVIRELTQSEFGDIDAALNAFRIGYFLISHFQKGDTK